MLSLFLSYVLIHIEHEASTTRSTLVFDLIDILTVSYPFLFFSNMIMIFLTEKDFYPLSLFNYYKKKYESSYSRIRSVSAPFAPLAVTQVSKYKL